MEANQHKPPVPPVMHSTSNDQFTVEDEFLVTRFREGESALSAEQEQHLATWIVDKPLIGNKVDLVLGGASKSSRAGRLRRLHGLLLVLERLGVAARRIRADIEWTRPARMGTLEDMPADTVWLRLAIHRKAHQ